MSYIEGYLLFLRTEKKLGDATIESYYLDLESFLCFIDKDILSISRDDVEIGRASCRERVLLIV